MTERTPTVPLPYAGEGAEATLLRRLTARQLSMISIGGAIGTGLFLGSGLSISQAGPAVILAPVRLRGGPAVPLVAIGVLLAVMATMAFVPPFTLAPLTGIPFLTVLLLVHLALPRGRGRLPKFDPERS